MTYGCQSDYFWVEWEHGFLSRLLVCVPDVVLGRYLVNTSFDSGSLTLSDEERRHGWRSAGQLTYSPGITDVQWVPHDQFEEWLVFAAPTEIQSWEALVNYSGISLTNPICDSLHERLWSQIESVRPESYLADGDRLIFITRSQELHKLALAHEDL